MEPVTSTALIKLGDTVAKVFLEVLRKTPSYEQKKMDKFFEFMNTYEVEVKRANRDHDDLIVWRVRKKLLVDTFLSKILEDYNERQD